jgi:hypothetical protein
MLSVVSFFCFSVQVEEFKENYQYLFFSKLIAAGAKSFMPLK